MPVRTRARKPHAIVMQLEADYTLQEFCQAVAASEEAREAEEMLVLDMRTSCRDHSRQELFAMSRALEVVSADVIVRTGDLLRYGHARELTKLCAEVGVTVHVDYEDHVASV